MSGKQYGMLLGVALVVGVIGGIGVSWLLTSRLVFAELDPPPVKVLQAERFEVVDRAGKIRAAFAGASNGALALTLYDKARRTRAILGLLADGTPHLGFIDRARKPRAILGTLPSGSTSLALLDKNGKVLWQAPSSPQQQGWAPVQRSPKTGKRSAKHHREGMRKKSKRRH